MKRLFQAFATLLAAAGLAGLFTVPFLLAERQQAFFSTQVLQPCSVYELKSYKEANFDAGLTVANFTAVTLFGEGNTHYGGQTNWVRLNQTEISFIKEINVNSFKTWNWADSPEGTIYLGYDAYSDITVKWPRIALSSNDEGINRNQVCVLGYTADKQYARIQGIPMSTDYHGYLPYKWLFHTAYTVYPDNHTGSLPLYIMPLWDPASGFQTSIGGQGLWLRTFWLYRKLGDWPPPSPTVTPVVTPSITPIPAPTTTPAPGVLVQVAYRDGKLLNIRPGPGPDNLAIGDLYPYVRVLVTDIHYGDLLDPQSVWGEFSPGLWIALRYKGVYYTDWRP